MKREGRMWGHKEPARISYINARGYDIWNGMLNPTGLQDFIGTIIISRKLGMIPTCDGISKQPSQVQLIRQRDHLSENNTKI